MIEGVIDLENGGAMVMRKSSRMMSGLYDQENCTFPSQMSLQFQAIRSACRFQRKYWIGAIVCGLLLIAGIVSAFVIIGKEESMKSTESTKNYSKKIHIFNRIEDKVKLIVCQLMYPSICNSLLKP